MSSQPYMQLWVADFIGDTLHLSSAEIGQYMLLLMAMWRNGGTLPDDPKKLARVARGAVCQAVMEYFQRDSAGGITQKRLMAELERAKAKSRARAESGRRGGVAKALKNQEAALANGIANEIAKPCHLPEPEPERKKKIERASRARPRSSIPEDWFPDEKTNADLLETFNGAELTAELLKFRLHYEANGKPMKNWNAAFRKWMVKSREFKPAGQRQSRTNDAFDQISEEIRNGTFGSGICDERGSDAVRQLPKPSPRSQDFREAVDVDPDEPTEISFENASGSPLGLCCKEPLSDDRGGE